METITITIKIDEEYRKKIEQFDVCPSFEWYLTGVLLEHLLKNGGMSKLVERVASGSNAAEIKLFNTVQLGSTMCGVINAV